MADPGGRPQSSGVARRRRGGGPASQHLCLRSLAGRRRWSGTSWSIWRSLPPWCKSSMLLCRRWVGTLQTPCGSWTSRLPSRLSMCPRSLALRVHHVLLFLSRSQRKQLVEVPTVLSPSRIALRIEEQIVDTPVPRGRGPGFLPEQSSTATSSSGKPTSFSGKRISERTVEQIVDISSSGGGLGQVSSSSASPADEDFNVVTHGKKCGVPGRWCECAAGWARQLIHAERSSNGSCRRARGLRRFRRVGAGPSPRHRQVLLLEQTYQLDHLGRTGGCRGRLGCGRRRKEGMCGAGTRSLVALRMLSLRCLLGDGLREEGLGIESHFLGATRCAVRTVLCFERPCDYAAQVPAVPRETWRCLSLRSSRECSNFQLCCRGVYVQCKLCISWRFHRAALRRLLTVPEMVQTVQQIVKFLLVLRQGCLARCCKTGVVQTV